MRRVQFTIFRHSAKVALGGRFYDARAQSLAVTDWVGQYTVRPCDASVTYEFKDGELQELRRDLAGLIESQSSGTPFWKDEFRCVDLSDTLMGVMLHLASVDSAAFLRFAYAYCLGSQPEYFSKLLLHLTDGSRDLFEYVDANSLNGWSVSVYADNLGIPTRKLNLLFLEKFGVSAKRWLIDRRMRRAKELLLMTQMRVTDIAQECGFNSHAHFSDSFRRHFKDCPTEMRERHRKTHMVVNLSGR